MFPTRRGNDHRTWQRNRDQYGHEGNSGTNNSPQSYVGSVDRQATFSVIVVRVQLDQSQRSTGGPNVHARGATDSTGACVYIQLRLRGRNIMCLLDTGCDTTLFPYSLVKRIKGISVTESNKRVLAANDTEVTIIGEAAIPLTLGFQCSPTLNHQSYEGRLPLTSWWRKSSSGQVVNSHLVCDPTIRQPGVDLPRQQWSLLNRFRTDRDTAVPAEGNGDLQTLICVFVARPRRCLTWSNPVP